MSALARTTEINCDTRAANEDCINGGPRTRTKYSYDAVGNTVSDTAAQFTYNNRGRMSSSTAGAVTTTYVYNAKGERIAKINANTTEYVVYDEHGHLLGEYGPGGVVLQETVWLGDTPVATVQPSGSGVSIFYIHSDHLNTPRIVTNQANQIVWRWDVDPFGAVSPNTNPSGLGVFTYNLRFPGQYFDAETGLNYNYFRDYDSQSGRFIESDFIGLQGGVNTYGYVGAQPIIFSDAFGLCPPGTHVANSTELSSILAAARAISSKGLTHDQMACNQFVQDSINSAFPGAVGNYTTADMRDGKGPYELTTTPSVGSLALFTRPGHVVFITSTADAAVKQFLGSQSSTGPAFVSLPDHGNYWFRNLNIPGNVQFLNICLPN